MHLDLFLQTMFFYIIDSQFVTISPRCIIIRYSSSKKHQILLLHYGNIMNMMTFIFLREKKSFSGTFCAADSNKLITCMQPLYSVNKFCCSSKDEKFLLWHWTQLSSAAVNMVPHSAVYDLLSPEFLERNPPILTLVALQSLFSRFPETCARSAHPHTKKKVTVMYSQQVNTLFNLSCKTNMTENRKYTIICQRQHLLSVHVVTIIVE